MFSLIVDFLFFVYVIAMLDSSLLHIPQPSEAGLFGYAAALLLIYWAAWVVYTRFFHPLSKYPGPF